jgi:hypothetical protein
MSVSLFPRNKNFCITTYVIAKSKPVKALKNYFTNRKKANFIRSWPFQIKQ